jgi:hypothetical protein
MGLSDRDHISAAFAWIREMNPSSILDIGVVFGKWGYVDREEFFDAWRGDRVGSEWKPRLVAIGDTGPHSDSGHMYDDIMVGDALDRIHDVGLFDLVITGGVLEHLTRVQADCMLVNASAIAKAVLVVAPGSDGSKRPQYAPHVDGHERLRTVVKLRRVRNMFRVLRHQTFESCGRGYWMALLEGQQTRAVEWTP